MGISIGVVNGEVGAYDASRGTQSADQLRQLQIVEARTSWRVHRRHYRLIEDIEIDMQPDFVQSTRLEFRDHPTRRGVDTISKDTLNRELCNLSSNDIAVVILEARTFGVTLPQLNDVSVAGKRLANFRPIGQQQLTSATRKSQVHTRRRPQALCCVVVPRMEKIAVSVDVHESSPTGAAHTIQTTKEDAAIATND